MQMTRGELIKYIRAGVAGFYDADEARVVAFAVAEHFCGVTRAQAVADPSADVAGCDAAAVDRACAELSAGRPLQYVLGEEWFCGRRFAVGEGVLIPRPETEMLVMAAADDARKRGARRLLDIGTGSGAIAVTLALSVPGAEVDAVDVSRDALRRAAGNAEALGATVRFVEADALAPTDRFVAALPGRNYDAIVSNPPYIPASEYASMRDNVRLWEPSAALFVPDDDPLVFYRAIAQAAAVLLSPGGRLWLEVHENFAGEVCRMLRKEGFANPEWSADMNDKPRIVSCTA